MRINFLLFEDFTALDVFGPLEVLSSPQGWQIRLMSAEGGIVGNHQGLNVVTERIAAGDLDACWLIPGGFGTRALVEDRPFLDLLGKIAAHAHYCLSVCTGSALLARCGALNGRRATSNQRSFDWVRSQSDQVFWEYGPRYVVDGKFYSSAGVSAGIDMALAFVAAQLGEKEAAHIAARMEYAQKEQR